MKNNYFQHFVYKLLKHFFSFVKIVKTNIGFGLIYAIYLILGKNPDFDVSWKRPFLKTYGLIFDFTDFDSSLF